MRRFLTTTFFATAFSATAAFAAPANYALDGSHTTVMFELAHLGYAPTIGVFGKVEGGFTYDMDTQDLSNVKVTIDAGSVNTFHAARDKHVNNKDLLDTSKHPEITFVATSSKASSDTKGTVTGDLTILGQTHPITLDVTLNKAANYPFGHKRFVLGLSLEGSLKRSQYGMNYGVAGGIIGDEVSIRIETEAMQMK